MNNDKKSDLSVVVRRTRKAIRSDVNTGGKASRTQCGGTIIISYTLDTSYAPSPV